MNLPKTFSSRQTRFVTTTLVLLVLLNLAVNLLVIGGDDFVFQLNTFLVSPLSILTSIAALLLWRQMKDAAQSRYIWGGLLIGWMLWALAEFLWALYSFWGQDPYPSPADIFFLLGYIPLSVGFLSRLRKLPQKPNKIQYLMLGAVTILAGYVTFTYIFVPMLQSYDYDRVLESVLGLFYPLADLFLLLIVLHILFTFGPGNYGMAWRLILTGFVTVTVSDLFFSYADWNGLYYPDSRATILSAVGIDWLYNVSYMFWAYGIYVLRVLLDEHEVHRINFRPQLVPNTYVLIFTDQDGRVSSVSQNYFHLFPVKDIVQRTLADLLGMSGQEEERIRSEFLTNKKFHEETFRITGAAGRQYEARISGLAIMTSPNQYDGAVVLLRILAEGGKIDDALGVYQKSLVSNILDKVNNCEKVEISRFLYDYHLAYIMSLYNLVLQEGGTPMTQAFLDELQRVSDANGWGMTFEPQMNWDNNPAAHPGLPHTAWTTLVMTAKNFTSQLTDIEKVDSCFQEVNAQFSEAVHKTALSLSSPENQ